MVSKTEVDKGWLRTMLHRDDIAQIIEDYDRMKLRIGMTASHSALDICDGGIEEGFPTVAYCQEGRHKTYANYFKTKRSSSGRVLRGMVDKAIVMPSFNDVMNESMQAEMRKRNVVYIPNRSFTSYSSIEDVENKFRVPLFGSRNMLRMEERTEEQDYYWILDKAGLPYPEAIENPEDIDCLVIVKTPPCAKAGTWFLHVRIVCRIQRKIRSSAQGWNHRPGFSRWSTYRAVCD